MEEQLQQSWQNMVGRLQDWLDLLITNLPNFVLALLTFVIFYIFSIYLKKILNKPLDRITKQESVKMLITRITSIGIIAIGFVLALGILNLDTVLKSILAGAGVAGLAVGLALQGTLSNTFSGVYLAIKEVINIGDWIETNGYSGTVNKITLRHTFITEPDNNQIIIPNRMVVENPFKNYGLTANIRVDLECGIAYDENLEHVKEVALKALNKTHPADEDRPIEFYYTEFGNSSINFLLRFWIKAVNNRAIRKAKSEAVLSLKNAFDKEGITIPFPIRTIDMAASTKKSLKTILPLNNGNE